jgi:Rieske Fe-S protein
MKRKETDTRRRAFLRSAMATGVAAGAATTAVDAVAGVLPETAETAKDAGYQLTAHVQAYYKSFTR